MHEHKHDIDQLETKIQALIAMEGSHTRKSTGDLERLIKVIRRPGWTTPAEYQMVHAQLEHLETQMKVVDQIKGALFRTADMIGNR